MDIGPYYSTDIPVLLPCSTVAHVLWYENEKELLDLLGAQHQ
jgi:hypothetical protein